MKLLILKNRRITIHEVDNSQKQKNYCPWICPLSEAEELLSMKLIILKNRRITTHEVANSQKQKDYYPWSWWHISFNPEQFERQSELDAKFVSHLLCLCMNFWLKTKWLIPHPPPYSPCLVQCDFLLFSKLKMSLKGRGFSFVTMI